MARNDANTAYQGYLKTSTKECLEHFTGCPQLYCAATRGIVRKMKHENRNRKRIQHAQNIANRAAAHQGKGRR